MRPDRAARRVCAVELTRTAGGLLGFALHGAGGEVRVIDLAARAQVATVELPGPATKGFPTGTNQHVLVPTSATAASH